MVGAPCGPTQAISYRSQTCMKNVRYRDFGRQKPTVSSRPQIGHLCADSKCLRRRCTAAKLATLGYKQLRRHPSFIRAVTSKSQIAECDAVAQGLNPEVTRPLWGRIRNVQFCGLRVISDAHAV